jgi:hypothetical protein
MTMAAVAANEVEVIKNGDHVETGASGSPVKSDKYVTSVLDFKTGNKLWPLQILFTRTCFAHYFSGLKIVFF